MCDTPHCGQRRLFLEAAPRIKIFSASRLQRASPLYSTFQHYICCTTHETTTSGLAEPLPGRALPQSARRMNSVYTKILTRSNEPRHAEQRQTYSTCRGSFRAPRLLHPTLWENRGLSYVRTQLPRSTVGRQSVGKSLSRMCKSSFFFFITLTYSSVC